MGADTDSTSYFFYDIIHERWGGWGDDSGVLEAGQPSGKGCFSWEFLTPSILKQ